MTLSSANLCFKQGVAGSFDFKTVFSASQETNPTMDDVVWASNLPKDIGLNLSSDGVNSLAPLLLRPAPATP